MFFPRTDLKRTTRANLLLLIAIFELEKALEKDERGERKVIKLSSANRFMLKFMVS